jgi:CRISPR-associated protein Cas1
MFDQLVTPDRLRAAWDLVSRDGLGAGADGEGVAAFQAAAELRLVRLAADLRGGTWRPGPWVIAGGAVLAPVADRVVMTAVATGLPEMGLPEMGRPIPPGDPAAVMARLAALRDDGAVYLLDGAVTHVTDLVPHGLLLDRVAAGGGDARLVDLIGLLLAAADDARADGRGQGIPRGLPVSALLAGLHLEAVATEIAAAGLFPVPAGDEILILATGAAAAEDARGRMLALLADHGLYVDVDLPRMIRLDQAGPRLGRIMARMMAPPRPADPAAGAEWPARPLYLLAPGHRLGIDDRAFTVEAAETGERLDSRPAAAVSRIELAPGVQAAAATLRAALARDIPVALLDGIGGVQAWLTTGADHHAPRHLAQARHLLDPARRHALARLVVDARLQNMQALLKRLDRRKRLVSVEGAAERLKRKPCPICWRWPTRRRRSTGRRWVS